jgi:hypothetical protein
MIISTARTIRPPHTGNEPHTTMIPEGAKKNQQGEFYPRALEITGFSAED